MTNKRKPATEKPPKKMGRPSLGDDALRHFVSLRLSTHELREWTAKAEAMGLTLREYILRPHRRGKSGKAK